MGRTGRTIFAAVMLCAWLAGSAQAETYRWTDDAGVVHFSDSYDKIPARYQLQASVENDLPAVNIMPADKAPEQAASETGAVQTRQEAVPAKKKSSKSKTTKKHAKKVQRKAKQEVKAPPLATTPARQAENQAEERIRRDRQTLDDAQLPARRAQEQADEQIRKARDGMAGH